MFDITTIPAHKMVCVTLEGFLDPDMVTQFGRAVQMGYGTMHCKSGEPLLLVDTTHCTLQAQEVVAAFQSLITKAPIKAKRIAVITGSSLSRMQTRRILVRDQAVMFDTRADAEAWLLSGELGQQDAA